jgi:phosphatidylserine/phosphatidylglycerophosphate/cardiolipin synthase-like enzyme
LIILLLILGGIWLYQNGYFDSLLGPLGEPSAEVESPETQDGAQAEAPESPAPVVPQPSAPAAEDDGRGLDEEPPAQAEVDTGTLRGFSGSWYQVYFTKPSYPEQRANRVGGLDEALVADINAAQQQIEVVSFDFDVTSIADALVQARERGVSVRVSVDGENLEAAEVAKVTGDLQAADIPVFFDERQAFMHDKFIVIDGVVVWTGSANLTVNDVFRNNNNMLRIQSPDLAANYLAKSEDIFTGQGGTAGGSVLVNPQLTIGEAQVVNAFAPDDAITDAIIERINAAQQSVDMMAFAFTSDPIAEALVQARQRELPVRAVMESRNVKGSGSEFNVAREGGIDMHADGNCYIMHHKVIIIDGRTVITGSFNFTRSAQDQNDENVLIIDDPSLAARYTEEFERVYQQALQPIRCG